MSNGAPSAERAVLVTGVARGIGRATAFRLRADGYSVVGVDREDDPPEGLAAFEIVDMADPAAAASVLAPLAARFSICRLVNNVGSSRREFLKDSAPEVQEWLNRLNIASAIVSLQAVLPAMRRAGFGRVVNMTSRAALGRDNRSAYAATKTGLASLTRSWALELAGGGITVNAVGPGMINTELFRRNNPPDAPDVARLRESVPMKRLGEPAEVAEAVAFFLRDAASYITGQMVYVCGGLSVWGGRS